MNTDKVDNPPSPTADQRRAADPAASVWVGASAGSGKTSVLTDRVLRLLLSGTKPERILCVTYTKAAAAEMEIRIHNRLATWAALDDAGLAAAIEAMTGQPPSRDLLAPARGLFARVIDAPGGLKIQNIHSFCESLLSRFPLEAGIAPNARVADERTSAELLAEARDRVLASARADTGRAESGTRAIAAALDIVARRADERGFAAVLDDLVQGRRFRDRTASSGGIDSAIAELARALGLETNETEESIIAAACRDEAFAAAALLRAAAILDRGSETDRERAAGIRTWVNAVAARAGRFDAYAKLFLTDEHEPRKKLATKAATEEDPAIADILATEAGRLAEIQRRRHGAILYEDTAALLRFGGAVYAEYERIKASLALVDYDDLILRTRALLNESGAAAWVLYKLDGGLDHILVDEAQDSSPDQWAIMAALAEEFFAGSGARDVERTIFVVGDEKQSIFSFQGADPSGFEFMRGHFSARVQAARKQWRTVPLTRSFRSAPSILRAVDIVFASPAMRAGVVGTNAPVTHVATRAGPGLVELWEPLADAPAVTEPGWPLPSQPLPSASAANRLADKIARRIRGWLDDGETLASSGHPIAPGDIMILVQRRGPFFEAMVRRLKAHGVPVAGTDRMVLNDQLAVMDLMALGRFVLLPDDDLTLATVLRGPLIDMDEDDLFALAQPRDKRSLWQELDMRRDERPVFANAHRRLSAWRARADYPPPYEFFAGILGAEGGRRQLLARLGPEANDPIDEFLALALAFERTHPPSLQAFLHWLDREPSEVKRDLAQAQGAVRVMTVHGAKGLEAPVVFLPDTCHVPRQDSRLLWIGDERPLPLWIGAAERDDRAAAAARADQRRQREEENRRLLYVAMTRAADRLYICGWQGRKTISDESWYRRVAEALTAQMEKLQTSDGVVYRLAEPAPEPARPGRAKGVAQAAEMPGLMSLPSWAREAAPPGPIAARPISPSRLAADAPPSLSPLSGGDGRRFKRGLIIHRMLQILPDLPPPARPAAAARYLALPAHALDDAAQTEIADAVLSVLDRPDLAAAFGPHSAAEVPIVGHLGGDVVAGQVDRLAIDANSIMVVDYKTQRPAPDDVGAAPAAYLAQMALYRDVLAKLYPDRPIALVLVWTDGPRVMPIPPAVLDAALEKYRA